MTNNGQTGVITADYTYTYPDFKTSNIVVKSGSGKIKDIHGKISEDDLNTLYVTLDGSTGVLYRL